MIEPRNNYKAEEADTVMSVAGNIVLTAKLHMMFALANLYLADKRCLTA